MNPNGLVHASSTKRKDYQEINVRVLVGVATGVGAEENDPIGAERRADATTERSDGGKGDQLLTPGLDRQPPNLIPCANGSSAV